MSLFQAWVHLRWLWLLLSFLSSCDKASSFGSLELVGMADIPERDWKLLRELKPVALERLCARILKRAETIAAKAGSTRHERYLKLYDMILKQNDEVAIAFDDHRRSTALLKIAQIQRRGLFTEGEFARFMEVTCRHVLALNAG